MKILKNEQFWLKLRQCYRQVPTSMKTIYKNNESNMNFVIKVHPAKEFSNKWGKAIWNSQSES